MGLLDTPRFDPAIGGAFSGMFAVTVSYPFDLLKTRMQFAIEAQSVEARAAQAAGKPVPQFTKPSLGFIGKTIYSEGAARYGAPGGIFSFYRGLDQLIPEAFFKVLFRFVFFKEMQNQWRQRIMHEPQGSTAPLSVSGNLICGAIAGFFEAAIVVQPFERGKTLRADFASPYKVWGDALKTSGPGGMVRSIYTGFFPCACRQIGNQAMGFSVFYGIKTSYLERLQRKAEEANDGSVARTSLRTHEQLSFGFLGGCAGAILTMPMDVAKTVAQKQRAGEQRSTFSILRDVAQSKGVRGLYTGLAPRLGRVGVDRACVFLAYEFIIDFLQKRREASS